MSYFIRVDEDGGICVSTDDGTLLTNMKVPPETTYRIKVLARQRGVPTERMAATLLAETPEFGNDLFLPLK